jgi:hypothetical protein
MPKHHVIDYDTFLPRLVSGLRQAWEAARRRRARETFYMFGIATDSNVVVLTPFWNTEENYANKGKREFPADKWVVPEEGYAPCKHTAALQTEVNRYVFEDHTKEPDTVFEKRKTRLLKIFEKALVQLDSEGFFGTGKKRQQVLLLIDRGDCSQAETQYMHRVIKRINPPQSRAKYFAAIKEQKRKDAAREREERRRGKRSKLLATAFLRRQKRPFDRFRFGHPIHDDDKAYSARLARLLPGKQAPDRLWEVWFESEKNPGGQMHGPGMIWVVVDPVSENCALGP